MVPSVGNVAKAFNNAVDQSFREILGDTAAEAIYDHLQRNYSVPRETVFTDFVKFTAAVRGIFAEASPTIERAIAKRFYSNLGLTFVAQPRLTLQDYVDEAISASARRRLDPPLVTRTIYPYQSHQNPPEE